MKIMQRSSNGVCCPNLGAGYCVIVVLFSQNHSSEKLINRLSSQKARSFVGISRKTQYSYTEVVDMRANRTYFCSQAT